MKLPPLSAGQAASRHLLDRGRVMEKEGELQILTKACEDLGGTAHLFLTHRLPRPIEHL